MSTKERRFGEFKACKARDSDTFTLTTDESGEKLIYTKTNGTNPWENGQFNEFDFKKNMQEVGNYGQSKDVGKERLEREQ